MILARETISTRPARPSKKMHDRAEGRWYHHMVDALVTTLASRAWLGDVLLRGSLARGGGDGQSDLDLVVTVAEENFEAAVDDLLHATFWLPADHLPPWHDTLVKDFGGIGLVYLVQVTEHQWGQVDIYLLPNRRRKRLLDHEPVRALLTRQQQLGGDGDEAVDDGVDAACRRLKISAQSDLQQAILACYVALFLLRKRLVRQNPLQVFADTYAAARCVRELIVLACHPERREHEWHGLPEVVQRSADPEKVAKTLSIFTMQDIFQPNGFTERVNALETVGSLLTPGIWTGHGELLHRLGDYLRAPIGGKIPCW